MVTGWKGLGSFTWKIAWFLHRFYDKDKTSSQAERYRDSLLHSCSTQKNVVELNLIMSFSNTSCGGYTNICIMTNDNTDRERERERRTEAHDFGIIIRNSLQFTLSWIRLECFSRLCLNKARGDDDVLWMRGGKWRNCLSSPHRRIRASTLVVDSSIFTFSLC